MSTLLSVQGPLANVWLASNYDKKLSKLQFLNTDIVSTSNLVSRRQLSASSTASGENTITLRLSGQLLLGIVRIYLRKTKYLLDDVHETLYKLKNSFKYASGASLGPAVASAVNLPPQKTTLSNPARIQLQDQVTDLDLLQQEDLVLGDESQSAAEVLGAAHFDRLIEVGRNEDAEADIDFDLDLDFDLDVDNSVDNSIEQGRDVQTALPDADQSLFDLNQKTPEEGELNSNLAIPLEPRPVDTNEPLTPGRADDDIANVTATARRARAQADRGVIQTAKRKLIVDNVHQLERGIPNSVLREIQNLQTNRRFTTDMLTVQLSLEDKLNLIEELAEPTSSKRRKLTNIDDQLRRRCLELSLEERSASVTAEDTTGMDMDMDIDMSLDDLDLNLSLPDLESDKASSPEPSAETPGDNILGAVDISDDTTVENLRSTAQVAGHLREVFCEVPQITFDELLEKDINIADGKPLGATAIKESSVKISERREATKCFFELLVLASQDCITLEQPIPERGVDLPGNPRIRPRDNLVTKFL